MKIAVTTEGSRVFQHFGQCGVFTVYTVEGGRITGKSVLDAAENGHAALGAFLQNAGVDVVICGGIGAGARQMLAEAGIELLSGMEGAIEDCVAAYMSGTLKDAGGSCGDHEHGEGHTCEHHCH